ncbi:MAG TPA: hypothetical protein DCL15_04620 [Chloroflexi bacterium]|nr:hypothetical protein [Chloroflexota bacterium]
MHKKTRWRLEIGDWRLEIGDWRLEIKRLRDWAVQKLANLSGQLPISQSLNLLIFFLHAPLHDFRQRTADGAERAGIERRLPGALKDKEGQRQDAQHAAQKGVHSAALLHVKRCEDAGQ